MANTRGRRRNSRRRGLFGVGSNQYKKRARTPDERDIDPKACLSHARVVKQIRQLDKDIAKPQQNRVIQEAFPPSSISASTDLPDDIVHPLAGVCARLHKQKGDLSIPQNAANAGDEWTARAVANQLRKYVDDPERVKVAKFSGMERRLFTSVHGTGDVSGQPVNRRLTDHLDIDHHAVLVSTDVARNSDRQYYVIDPSIAALAPVSNHQVPVEEQLYSTPYGDFPCVKTLEEYQDNPNFSWSEYTVTEN